MIRRHLMALRVILMIGDGTIAAAVFLGVSLVRFGDGDSTEFWHHLGIDTRVAALLFGVAWVSALWSFGLYRLRVRWRLVTEAGDIARTTLVVMAVTLSTLFIVDQPGVSRLFLILLFLVQPAVTLAGRAAIRYGFGVLRHQGINPRFMLVVGTGGVAQDFADRVENRVALGIRIIGHVSVPEEPLGPVSRRVLGTVDDISTIFRTTIIDEVAVCLPPAASQWLSLVTNLAASEGKTVRVPLDPSLQNRRVAQQEEFEGFLVRSVVDVGPREAGLVAKRLVDVAGAVAGLIVLSPVLLGVALVLRVREGAPVLFRQTRVGLHGRPFEMLKFRSMVPDAESLLDGLWGQSDMVGPAIQLTNDPRVTKTGRFLRRYSLDELPQLWNVFRGEMSLVGPRPAPIVEVDGYDQWHRRRLSVKPGITGLAQVTIRKYRDFDDRAELDMRYIEAWSIWLDLRIMAQTFMVVLGSTGR
jgi:exopolysaccharide biosynthesis polyprenyl glycosylphosphotransferase